MVSLGQTPGQSSLNKGKLSGSFVFVTSVHPLVVQDVPKDQDFIIEKRGQEVNIENEVQGAPEGLSGLESGLGRRDTQILVEDD